jgi:hypothetical protein
MNKQEFKFQTARNYQYLKLTERRHRIHQLLNSIDPNDNSTTPFSGAWADIRKVGSLQIQFSKPQGKGGIALGFFLENLNIPAYELGNFLTVHLNKEIETINEQIEKL